MHRLFIIPLAVLSLLVIGVLAAIFLHLSPGDVMTAVADPETGFAVRMTLYTSLSATLFAMLLGIPSGYILARRQFKGKMILDTLLDLPLAMPPLVAGVGLLFLFGRDFLGRLTDIFDIHILFSPFGAILAQAFIATPIMTRSCKAAFMAVNPRFELAAQTLGLRPHKVFFRVTLPMARNGILTGTVLAWARAVGEFGATLMVAGGTRFKTETLPIAVYLNISSGELGIALACAWLLIITGFILLFLLKWIGRSPQPDTMRFIQ